MVGNVATKKRMASNPTTCVLAEDSSQEFAAIASDIAERGSIPGIQLAEVPPALEPARKWRTANPLNELARLREIVDEFSAIEIEHSLRDFAEGAARAVDCGFAAVQVHAAHGYFLSLLLSADCNLRRDRYALEEQWLEGFVEDLRKRVPPSTLLSFRLSINAGFRDRSAEFESITHVIERLGKVDVDYIDLSAGFYTVDRTLIYPIGSKTSRLELPYYEVASAIARRIPKPFVFAGNLRDVRALPVNMPENLMVAAARAFIADPEFAEKSAQGRYDAVIACDRKNACHYFTRGKHHITCGVNPQLGGTTYED